MQHQEHSEAIPIACDLGVFDADERARHETNAQAVLTSADAVNETAHGYAFRLAADPVTLQRVGAFIAQESRCCPFFRFDLSIQPGAGEAWLEISGSTEVKAYMTSELLGQLQRSRPDLEPDQRPSSSAATREALGANRPA